MDVLQSILSCLSAYLGEVSLSGDYFASFLEGELVIEGCVDEGDHAGLGDWHGMAFDEVGGGGEVR